MMIRRIVHYCIAALAMCVGSIAFAGVQHQVSPYLGHMLMQDQGSFGKALAKFKAEQTYMASSSVDQVGTPTGLIRDSHGFLQATADEVTKGTTGSTVSIALG